MSLEYFHNKINNLSPNCVDILKLDGNNILEVNTELLIIPGFSESSFVTNYKTLFVNYPFKLQNYKFKRFYLIKFSEETIYNLHQEILNSANINNIELIASLENSLYEKCGQIIFNKLDKNISYSVLAKSTGAGPAIFICNSHPEIFNSLNLFAPGVKYLNRSIKKVCKCFPQTIVGWNSTDTKVRLIDVWFTLNNILPNKTMLYTYYYPDSLYLFDTQHEINTGFFDKIT